MCMRTQLTATPGLCRWLRLTVNVHIVEVGRASLTQASWPTPIEFSKLSRVGTSFLVQRARWSPWPSIPI